MKKKVIYSLVVVLLMSAMIVGFTGCGSQSTGLLPKQDRLRVATTTSLYDTGLWSRLEPVFEDRYDVELDVLYAGTGIAIEYGQRGDVDAITVHSKSREEQFVTDGYGIERVPFAYNYFLIVGPAIDPAGI
jgi:tungstate transport system substrate-binding protein